ncbi:MAG: hypothetical protein WCJ37_13545 [Syntrophus sp. (in: bacteria)]
MKNSGRQWMRIVFMTVIIMTVLWTDAKASETDYLIVPGKSVGKMRIGMSKMEVLKLLGKPTDQDKTFLLYKAKRNDDTLKIYLSNSRVAQIEFKSAYFRTADGISTANYNNDNNAGKFNKFLLQWLFINSRYVHKEGGLSFYRSNVNSMNDDYPTVTLCIVYKGTKPFHEPLYLDEEPNGGWRPVEGPNIW